MVIQYVDEGYVLLCVAVVVVWVPVCRVPDAAEMVRVVVQTPSLSSNITMRIFRAVLAGISWK